MAQMQERGTSRPRRCVGVGMGMGGLVHYGHKQNRAEQVTQNMPCMKTMITAHALPRLQNTHM